MGTAHTVRATKVFELVTIPPDAHQRMFIPKEALVIGAKLWLHKSRISSLGSSIGTFSVAWKDGGWIGPKAQTFTMLTEYARPVYPERAA